MVSEEACGIDTDQLRRCCPNAVASETIRAAIVIADEPAIAGPLILERVTA